MSITRPPVMSKEEAEKVLSEMMQRGASIRVSDPRVTAGQNWMLGTIAAGLLAGFVSLFNAVNSLKEQNATLIAEIRFAASERCARHSPIHLRRSAARR